MTLAGHELVWVYRGRSPQKLEALYIKLSSDVHILYFILTLAGHELVWGPGGGANEYFFYTPEAQRFWAINNGQMSIFLYLICDTGRTRIDVGSRGRSPQKLRCFIINYRSDEHILYLYL